jgi:signal transduction histidine kinase
MTSTTSTTSTAKATTRAGRDALIAGALVACGGLLFTTLDAVEHLTAAVLRFERVQLDDLMLTSFLAVAVATWFAFRRWRESAHQLHALQVSEADKARYVRRLEELSAELLDAEERERARLAHVLHDEVGQTLYACRLQLERLKTRVQDAPAQEMLEQAHALASDAMEQTRELTSDLSPPILHDLGLREAIEWLLSRVHTRYGLRARCIDGDDWDCIPQRFHAPVYHSVRELLVNAAKHARASVVDVSAAARGDRDVCVRVADDGQGFDPSVPSAKGFGLFSIERRMACMGAELRIESSPRSGTAATLWISGASAQ